jgi:hypothetical protein
VVLEEAAPLGRSVLWRLQREYYQREDGEMG